MIPKCDKVSFCGARGSGFTCCICAICHSLTRHPGTCSFSLTFSINTSHHGRVYLRAFNRSFHVVGQETRHACSGLVLPKLPPTSNPPLQNHHQQPSIPSLPYRRNEQTHPNLSPSTAQSLLLEQHPLPPYPQESHPSRQPPT